MSTITQREAVRPEAMGGADRVRFWRAPHLDGLDGLAARFVRHRYAPHSHDTWAMGTVTAGCESFAYRGVRHRARPGQVLVMPPGEVHDGEPEPGGFYEYAMLYPSERLVAEVARDLAEGSGTRLSFAEPVIDDPALAAAFARAHRQLGGAPDGAEGETGLLEATALLLTRHAGIAPRTAGAGRERGPVARALALIEERHAEPLGLAELADAAGLSRFRLIRAFRREVGLTPHNYLIDRRVRAAVARLRSGSSPAEAAAQAGFSDQSHMTRAFKARLGVTPAVFRRGR